MDRRYGNEISYDGRPAAEIKAAAASVVLTRLAGSIANGCRLVRRDYWTADGRACGSTVPWSLRLVS